MSARRALAAIASAALALAACAEPSRPPPPAPPPAPPEAPWPGDGLPGLIPDLEALLAGTSLTPARRSTALFRLAALRDDGARSEHEDGDGLPAALAGPIALYERLLREHPDAPESAAALYYLGHALNDSGRPLDAARAWRSLVCHDRYPYKAGSEPPVSLPQDHEPAYWAAWEARYRAQKPAPGDETVFVDPYPADCRPVPGAEPRYASEVWWRLGEQAFDLIDLRGGPFNYARAESAYQHALAGATPPLRGVALYKLAWAYFKAERYEDAARTFVRVLRYADEEQKRTGDSGLDLRTEAVTYIAGSLTYMDMKGPPKGAPDLSRLDVLDTERDPKIAEQKLHVAVDRVQDPAFVPQREPWTPDIVDALSREMREMNMPRNALELDEIFLRRWPQHPLAAGVRARVAAAAKPPPHP